MLRAFRSDLAAQPLKLLRRFREVWLVVLAAGVGVAAGVAVSAMSALAQALHALLFVLESHERLSAQPALAASHLALIPACGGALIGLSLYVSRRRGLRSPVDPIEANALHGGRMSMTESVRLALQTMVSSGFGASVGLEAGYTQVGSAMASKLAVALSLRRREVRMLVGCGAAGAISAAFDAPIAGAFYGFELIIGTYSVSLVAPVMAAALTASLTTAWLGAVPTPIEIGHTAAVTPGGILWFLALGLCAGVAAVALMRLVTAVETLFRLARCPTALRPLIAGLIVGGLGLISPQVLSSGHGALHLELTEGAPWRAIALLFALKALASAVSLGGGFRGGLFFASLLLGALGGELFAALSALIAPAAAIDPLIAAVVGMGSMAVGVVGGPLTMTFLVLETTGDIAIGSAVLAAALVSAIVVRETFGYSFSTWRLHLRGETIRGAQDVGWMRNLTVRGMMRSDVRTVSAAESLAGFIEAFPLGSTQRVIAVDQDGLYAGVVIVAEAHAARAEANDGQGAAAIASLLRYQDAVLLPAMNAQTAAKQFESVKSEELAVVDGFKTRRVLGLLTEQHLLRRYAQELDQARRDLGGEG